ncbi:molecular chaperone [Kosakonia quasisacchari]|uniref:fimbrial biogenesis chaperone n=1 Tax=Kosakonia quasisacchari TaxID=2529380 RepID=UPI0039E0B725
MSKYKKLTALFLFFMFGDACASVTMVGTRVIYPADIKEKALAFTNTGNEPVLVQVWADKDNPQSTPETADAPFLLMPSIFRINPTSEHTLRLKFTGAGLPQDRESLFWLNFLQYPARKTSDRGQNSLTVLVKSRLKLFYRPASLTGDANHSLDDVKVSLRGQAIEINNTGAYHISVISAFTQVRAKKYPIKYKGIIVPHSVTKWDLPSGGGDSLTINAINDYGGVFSKSYSLVK